jgi:hypothetical protein
MESLKRNWNFYSVALLIGALYGSIYRHINFAQIALEKKLYSFALLWKHALIGMDLPTADGVVKLKSCMTSSNYFQKLLMLAAFSREGGISQGFHRSSFNTELLNFLRKHETLKS